MPAILSTDGCETGSAAIQGADFEVSRNGGRVLRREKIVSEGTLCAKITKKRSNHHERRAAQTSEGAWAGRPLKACAQPVPPSQPLSAQPLRLGGPSETPRQFPRSGYFKSLVRRSSPPSRDNPPSFHFSARTPLNVSSSSSRRGASWPSWSRGRTWRSLPHNYLLLGRLLQAHPQRSS